MLTDEQNVYAVNTEDDGVVKISVPVFCRCLVERIVSEAPDDWDVAAVATHVPLADGGSSGTSVTSR